MTIKKNLLLLLNSLCLKISTKFLTPKQNSLSSLSVTKNQKWIPTLYSLKPLYLKIQ